MSRRRTAKRAGWAIGDQGFSSLTNFALNVLIARSLGVAEFGAFALAFATYLVVLNVSRAVATEPLVIRYSSDDAARWRTGTRQSTGVALVVGLGGGLVCIGIAGVTGGTLAGALLGLALVLPGLLLQDAWRYAFFAAGAGHRAFVNDLVWAVFLFPAFFALARWGTVTAFAAVVVWGAAAGAAGLFGMVQGRLVPRPAALVAWWQEHRDLVPAFLGEFLAVSGTKEAVIVGVGGIAGLAAAGALRAGQILLGPLRILYNGAQHMAVPEGVRLHRQRPEGLPRVCATMGATLGLAGLAFGGVLLVLPDSIGAALMGDSWEPARPVLLPLTLAMAAAGALRGALMGLRVLAAASESFRARLLLAVLTVVGALGGATADGALGAAWGLAGAQILGVAVWWVQFRRAWRGRARSAETIETEAATATEAQGMEDIRG